MSSKRTKALLWLSALPASILIGVAAWVMAYSSYLSRAHQESYFIVLHVHWLSLLTASAILPVCGLISLVLDKRSAGKK